MELPTRCAARTLSLALVAVLVASLVTVATVVGAGAGQASSTLGTASAQGRVRGEIVGARGAGAPKVKISWFAKDWTFLGTRKAYGGGYSLSLPPGTYHLQFVDQRPAYDTSKYAPTDALVKVRLGHTAVKTVHMVKGAAIGGTVRAGGKPAGGARIVAANADQRSFETTANNKGEFALGGLPAGNYSVFTYDHKHAYVGKSVYVPKLKPGSYQGIKVNLDQRGGNLLVDLYAGKAKYPGKAYVTAVSSANGQFWTARASHGSVTFRGLFRGGYKLIVPGAGDYLGATVKAQGKVKPSRLTFSSARLTKKGASINGVVVDGGDSSYALAGATVSLVDRAGTQLGSVTSAKDGGFHFGGQLTTQSGLTVKVGPGPNSPYLGQGTHYCKFGKGSDTGIHVTTGHATGLGKVAVPRLPNSQQDGVQCYTLSGLGS